MNYKKVIFITNVLSSHQVGLWLPFSKFEDVKLIYLCTSDINEVVPKRHKTNVELPFAKYSKEMSNPELLSLLNGVHIIFYGSIDDPRVRNIISEKKNAFLCTEHHSKSILNSYKWLLDERHFYQKLKGSVSKVNFDYIFCASGFAGHDFYVFGAKKHALLRFGYFPIYSYASDSELINRKDIFYTGRNVYWKHPEDAIFAYKLLKDHYSYKLTLCGEGLDTFLNVKDCNINYIPFLENALLLKTLKKFDIYIFSSDRNEGWGCVLSEALASGCIVFANYYAGSTRYLVRDGFNGFVYKTEKQLKRKILRYMKMDDDKKIKIRKNAVEYMKTVWDGKEAARRLHHFVDCYLNRIEFKTYKDGPLSLDKYKYNNSICKLIIGQKISK